MTQTNNLKINLVAQSQSQKEITINEGIARLEALQNRGVIDKDLSTPPASPAEGDTYIVKATATGDWLGNDGQLAYYNQGWNFIAPNEGLLAWVADEDKLYIYNGLSWVSYADNLQNLALLGINSTADTTNRFAVSADAALLNASTAGDFRLKINKSSTSNVASVLYQKGFSGRAEIGNIGDDNFRFKVSADGSTWNDSIIIDNSTGNTNLSTGFTAGGGTVVKKVISATSVLDFPSISANSSSDLTVTVTGAISGSGSTVELGLPNSPVSGIIYMGFVSAADTVTVRAFNVTGSAINPASQTFRVTVLVF